MNNIDLKNKTFTPAERIFQEDEEYLEEFSADLNEAIEIDGVDTSKSSDWTGALVKIEPAWMDPGERDIPYLVLEDYGDRVRVQELREYTDHVFLGQWTWSKDWCYIIDRPVETAKENELNELAIDFPVAD